MDPSLVGRGGGGSFAALPVLQRLGLHLHAQPLLFVRLRRLSKENTKQYGRYLGKITHCHPSARATTADETKRMMRGLSKENTKQLRRLSKENTKQYGRYLGKITHCHPSVEMMKYLTPLSFDCLTYSLLSHLASPAKTRLKEDGLNVGLLQYITNTLKSGQSLQLLVLRDLAGIDMLDDLSETAGIDMLDDLSETAGIDMLDDLSAEQLQAISRNLGSISRNLESISDSAGGRRDAARETLQRHGLVAPLFLLIAQQRSATALFPPALATPISLTLALVFLTDSPQLKLETLEQFQSFCGANFSADERELLRRRALPTVGELCAAYNVEPEGKEAPAEKAAADKARAAETLAALEASQGLRTVLPEGCWDLLSPQLYGTFWRLSLYDILSLKLLGHWKSGEEVYRNECAKLPGFSTSFINQQANAKKASYEDFVKAVVFKWYCKVLKALMACLDSKEYMEVDVLRSEERKDLQIQASQYYSMLQKAKPKLLTQDQFCCGAREREAREREQRERQRQTADAKSREQQKEKELREKAPPSPFTPFALAH
ncbi:hypothetical protein EMIHUDRAFT_208068 [Emiliania huxleyi CCMP1516]|uniref:THO complex subunitTHOC2 C-terminal domain-containing protein n=2 Tax=Emiliania huxleyi TaxID=2903 RepID=A0A0D3JBV7_EMIH1|nr:hypothetical protein EMIHUDRAFT_208068 [Emiliania huxleyi CCMP1516]EOD20992.1 hypothetical protein EMIHUDRAFT_208068 [Emiliania huxleyi CCMP1516]|eukprot:XP_005773421.1 hypothetical protein EMIHUDRAFT_208068 [Emiliania huxleyi CCMP1516]